MRMSRVNRVRTLRGFMAVLLLSGVFARPASAAATVWAQAASGAVAFGIVVPARATPNRAPAFARARPLYVSPSTQSLTIVTDGSNPLNVNLLPGAPGCRTAATGLVCIATLRVAPGTHVFRVTTYDRPNSTGNVLSANSTGPVAVKSSGTTYVPLTLEGVASRIALTLGVPDPDVGAPLTIALTAVISDADGNIIVGAAPFLHPVRLSSSDGANGALSRTILASPADESGLSVRYSGARAAAITFGATAVGLTAIVPAHLTPMTWTEAMLYAFAGGAGGSAPKTELLGDASGALYGTTPQGVVFKLTPPAGAATAWAEHVIGNGPNSRLVADSNGVLYGAFDCAAACPGSIYALTPGPAGYTARTIYTFLGGSDGFFPTGGLTFDRTGALYGTTATGGNIDSGTVYKLTPTAAGYVHSVIYRFGYLGDGNDPYGGVIVDAGGTLYGTTQNGPTTNGPGSGTDDGTVFALTPAPGAYSETLLYVFGGLTSGDARFPNSRLLAGSSGLFYGTTVYGGTADAGTVFAVSPNPPYEDIETILHTFSGGTDGAYPIAGLAGDANGSLYGTTTCGGNGSRLNEFCLGAGVAFRLIPTPTGYQEEIVHNFNDSAGDGAQPNAGLLFDSAGDAYGTTTGGGAHGLGTVYQLKHVKAVP